MDGLFPKGKVTVGDLRVDVGARVVTRDDAPIELPKLSFDLLLALIEAAPAALSTDELMARVWPGKLVSNATIAKRVELLRQALGDDADAPRYVMLVRGFGYRLATTVETPASLSAESKADGPAVRRNAWLAAVAMAVVVVALGFLFWSPAPPEPPKRSLAVLPFQSLGSDPADARFADGLGEEISHALARSGELRVTGRTSVLAYRDTRADARTIGAALGVANLLEGTVRREGERVMVVMRLTSTRDGFQRWSESFDFPMREAAKIQRAIAQRVAERFQLPTNPHLLVDAAGTSSDPEAYALYLQAVSLSPWPTGPRMDQAQELIERVVQLDPGFAPGWVRRAVIHGRRLYFDSGYPLASPVALQTIRQSIERALAIDPTNGEAYAALAGMAWAFDLDLVRAAGLLEQSMRLEPWRLEQLAFVRDFVRAIGDLELSRDLGAYILSRDPLCTSCRAQYAGTLTCLGDLEGAEREYRIIGASEGAYPVEYFMGRLRLLSGDLEGAGRLYEGLQDPLLRQAGQVQLQFAAGEEALARQSFKQLLEADPDSGYAAHAATAALLGEAKLATELLRAVAQRQFAFVQGEVCDPYYDRIADTSEWQELMEFLGFNADGSQAVAFEMPPLPGEIAH